MKDKINDGGQAYPTGQLECDPRGNILFFQKEGMTLRDYFAAKAMQGLFASWGQHDVEHIDDIASDAYNMADAMLKAREAA